MPQPALRRLVLLLECFETTTLLFLEDFNFLNILEQQGLFGFAFAFTLYLECFILTSQQGSIILYIFNEKIISVVNGLLEETQHYFHLNYFLKLRLLFLVQEFVY